MGTVYHYPYNIILYAKPVPFPGDKDEKTWVQIQHHLMMRWLYDSETGIRQILPLPLGKHAVAFASPFELFLDSLRVPREKLLWIAPRGPKQSLESLLSVRYENARFVREDTPNKHAGNRDGKALVREKPVSIFSVLESALGLFYAQMIVTILDGIEEPIEEAAKKLEALALEHRKEDERMVGP